MLMTKLVKLGSSFFIGTDEFPCMRYKLLLLGYHNFREIQPGAYIFCRKKEDHEKNVTDPKNCQRLFEEFKSKKPGYQRRYKNNDQKIAEYQNDQ